MKQAEKKDRRRPAEAAAQAAAAAISEESPAGSRRWRRAFAAAFPHTLPVMAGMVCLGLAYGVLMQTKGYGPLWSGLMSAIAFCGSMQFVAITLLTMAFDPLQAFLMSLLVNVRHLFYGISMLKKYAGADRLKFFLIYLMCDETFSLNVSLTPPEGVKKTDFYFAISTLHWSYWVASTVVGGLLGGLIQFDTMGMDFILTALFVTLFLEQWKVPENRPFCLLGIVASVVSLLVLGADAFILPAMLLILLVLLIWRRGK